MPATGLALGFKLLSQQHLPENLTLAACDCQLSITLCQILHKLTDLLLLTCHHLQAYDT